MSQTILKTAEVQAYAAEVQAQLPVPCIYCSTHIPPEDSHCPGCGAPAGESRLEAAAKADQPQPGPTDNHGENAALQIWQKISDGSRTITIIQQIHQDQ